jgi:hypothetical protein
VESGWRVSVSDRLDFVVFTNLYFCRMVLWNRAGVLVSGTDLTLTEKESLIEESAFEALLNAILAIYFPDCRKIYFKVQRYICKS